MREKIKVILKNILEIDEVPEDISQEKCMEWDSMHHLQIIFQLESDFNVSFEPEDIIKMISLNEIEKILNKFQG